MSKAGATAEVCDVPSPGVIDARNAERRFSIVAEHCQESHITMKSDISLLMKASQRHDAARGHVLAEPQFLAQLQREMRRADRSKAALSIVQYRPRSDSRSERTIAEGMSSLVRLLTSSRRETDILGCVGEDAISLLLVDTDAVGLEQFMRRMAIESGHLPFLAVTATYPDQVFDDLVAQDRDLEESSIDEFVSFEHKGFQLRVKRIIDVIGSLAGIVLLLPLLLLTALAIAVTSPGPIIFKQIRVGRRGKPFSFYKFRSMKCNVDDKIHREYVTNLIQGNLQAINQGDTAKPLYKIKSDPRVTGVGRFIRKTSIDELPQLFNVVKGDMSLVGPRPPLPYEVEKYKSWHLRRVLEAKPGITGLWQVEGRSKVSFEDMVRMDIRYSRNWSLMLDLRILLKTVKVVAQCSGAN